MSFAPRDPEFGAVLRCEDSSVTEELTTRKALARSGTMTDTGKAEDDYVHAKVARRSPAMAAHDDMSQDGVVLHDSAFSSPSRARNRQRWSRRRMPSARFLMRAVREHTRS